MTPKTPAAILVKQHAPLVVDQVALPGLGYGQVLVEIKATRICGSQIGELDGVKGPDRWLPHLLGHEAGGTVLEIGPEVRYVRPGDRVVCHWRKGRGIDAQAPVYDWQGHKVNAGQITTFQQFSVISENRLTVVPPDTDLDICCLLADTLTTGFGVINNDARVKIGESVAIIGCGGIGLGTVLGAKLAGANPIIAIDRYDHKLQLATKYGATHTINSARDEISHRVERIVSPLQLDVVVDGTGDPIILAQAYELVRHGGRCIGVGVMAHDRRLSVNTLPLHLGATFSGSHGGDSQPAEDIPRYVRMMRDGCFNPKEFVTHRIKLADVNDGIAKMRAGEVVHCIIHFDGI
jgi:S-(hydroxymethyl)glutathione dehydrogenase/alcohol dehydrogenase